MVLVWHNDKAENTLEHSDSGDTVARVAKGPVDRAGTQMWELHLPWLMDPGLFDRRVDAKAWGRDEAGDYVERYYGPTGWKAGYSPAEARVAAAKRKIKQAEHIAKAKATQAAKQAQEG